MCPGRRVVWFFLAGVVLGACDDGLPGPTDARPLAPPDGAVANLDGANRDGAPAAGFTRLHVRVINGKTGALLGAQVALFEEDSGELLRFGIFHDDGSSGMGSTLREIGGSLPTWHGLAIWQGEATVPVGEKFGIPANGGGRDHIPYGRYRLVASHGIEYDLTEARVDLGPARGDVFVEIPLTAAVDTSGYLGADMHVHSAGSSDSFISFKDRVKTMVVAGVDVVVSTEHDYFNDLSDSIRDLYPPGGPPPPLVSIGGSETSHVSGHFGVYPVLVDRTKPRNGASGGDVGQLPTKPFMLAQHNFPGGPLLQLNHARLAGGPAYFNSPQCGPWTDRSHIPPCALDFDAMEVLAGYLVCGKQIQEQVKDFYALINFGYLSTAVGNSDTHGSSNLLGGFPRTFVRVVDDRIESFSQDEFIAALRAHRAIASTGPFITLRVNGQSEGDLLSEPTGQLTVDIRMQAASWVIVDEVRLLVNGEVVKRWPVPRVGDATPLLDIQGEPLTVTADAFITVEADGRKALPPFVVGEWTSIGVDDKGHYICPALPGAEQGMAVFAITNPVYVDKDGDGMFQGPKQPATRPIPLY